MIGVEHMSSHDATSSIGGGHVEEPFPAPDVVPLPIGPDVQWPQGPDVAPLPSGPEITQPAEPEVPPGPDVPEITPPLGGL